jgi:hypothetical protein
MSKHIFLIGFACIFFLTANAQTVNPPVNCDDAVLFCDSIIVQDTIKVAGTTGANEISSNSCLPYGEVRGTWYKFGVNATGNLRFLITPLDTTVDFDWALFNTSWNPCTDIFGVPSYEVSCNASGIGGGNYTTGATGMVQQGHNPAINVSIPTVFYLYVTTTIDYLTDTNVIMGYTIDFTGSDFNLAPCNEIGIEKNADIVMNAYPNPFENFITIEMPTTEDADVQLYDLSGRNVEYETFHYGNKYYLITENLAKGMYTVFVQTEKGISQRKLIKN